LSTLKDLGGNGRGLEDREVFSGTVRVHVDKILASKEFVHADSLRRFLSYTVEKAIEGDPGCLKETLLGAYLFGRGEAFDPRIDPIVRVQAGKLRSRLQRYYEGEGREDALVIEFPKGGYVPVFRARVEQVAPAIPRIPGRRWTPGWVTAGLIVLVLALALTWRKWPAVSSAPTFTQITFATASTAAFPSISREGKLVVFASDRGGRGSMNLFVQAVGGEGPVQLTQSPSKDRQPDISPDGTRIVFHSDRDGGGVYLLSLLSRVETRIVDTGYNPRFSPDGARIAYQGPQDKLYTVAAMGGLPQPVVSASSPALFPLWTRDGKQLLAMVRISDTEFDWMVFPLESGRAFSTGARDVFRRQQLGNTAHPPTPGDWLGDRVIFSSAHNESTNLWELPLSPQTLRVSGAARQLTSGPGVHTYPRTAPEAAGHPRIVFVNENIVPQVSRFAPNAAHSEENPALEHVTQDSSLIPDASPQLSSDGSKLAYCSARLGNPDVWLKDLKSGAETPVAANPWPEDTPRISPNGSRVAYVSRLSSGAVIQIWDAPGGATRKLCEACGAPVEWMPDNKRILVAGPSPPRLQIWNTVTGEHQDLLPALMRPIQDAAVSPDGRWIAITAPGATDACPAAFIAPLERQSARTCHDWTPLPESAPIWGLRWAQPGDLLYFFSSQDGSRCVWAQRLAPPNCQPAGMPFAVQHFHRYQPSPWAGTGISIAAGRLAVWFQDAQSSIWMAELH
jgi:Tol biopolymer transport system component